jgi:hypothetical protein
MASAYKIKAKKHEVNPLWKECKLQTYFTGHRRIDYFVVTNSEVPISVLRTDDVIIALTQPEKELFAKLEEDYTDVKGDIKEQASIVHDFRDSRSKRVP